MDCHATGLAESLVIEACLADLEDVPVIAIELLVDVYDVKTFILHGNQLCVLLGPSI